MRPTLKDISRLANLSEATVSMVLNGRQFHRVSPATRKKIEDLAKELGYVPNRTAQNLAKGSSQTVAVLCNDLSNMFYAQYISLLQDHLAEFGYTIFPFETRGDLAREASLMHWLEQRYFDGMICLERYDLNEAEYTKFESSHPLVWRRHGGINEVAGNGEIVVDYGYGFRQLLGHLKETGRRNPGFMLQGEGPGPEVDAQGYHVRLYSALLNECGLGVNLEHWRQASESVGLQVWYDRAVELLKSHPEIDAMLVHNAVVTPPVYKAAIDCGRQIGKDLAIMTHDETTYTPWLRPGVTVICEPIPEIARQLADMLLRRLKDRKAVIPGVSIKTRLILRESTQGPART